MNPKLPVYVLGLLVVVLGIYGLFTQGESGPHVLTAIFALGALAGWAIYVLFFKPPNKNSHP